MKTKYLIATVLVLAAALIPAAAMARTHYKVSVSIRYGADSVLRGKVTSKKARCRNGVRVSVYDVASGKKIGSSFASKKGAWSLSAPGLTNLVQATVGRSGTSLESGVSFVCDRAESPKIAPVDI
jgi:hypothetical protein